MGLFESFGKNGLQRDITEEKTAIEEKQANIEQPVENSEEVVEIKKDDFEAFKSNLDKWDRNNDAARALAEEKKELHSKISKVEEELKEKEASICSIRNEIDDKESDLRKVEKTGYGKRFSRDEFTLEGSLLPVLETDFNNGYMTERQKVYLSNQVDEVCIGANISSIDRLKKIINVFCQSDVADSICDNSVLPQLIYRKRNQLKIRSAVITLNQITPTGREASLLFLRYCIIWGFRLR